MPRVQFYLCDFFDPEPSIGNPVQYVPKIQSLVENKLIVRWFSICWWQDLFELIAGRDESVPVLELKNCWTMSRRQVSWHQRRIKMHWRCHSSSCHLNFDLNNQDERNRWYPGRMFHKYTGRLVCDRDIP
jgi:hypothetical protein